MNHLNLPTVSRRSGESFAIHTRCCSSLLAAM